MKFPDELWDLIRSFQVYYTNDQSNNVYVFNHDKSRYVYYYFNEFKYNIVVFGINSRKCHTQYYLDNTKIKFKFNFKFIFDDEHLNLIKYNKNIIKSIEHLKIIENFLLNKFNF